MSKTVPTIFAGIGSINLMGIYAGLVMSFYSIYLINGLVELHSLQQEHVANTQDGRLVSTQKNYQAAWDSATALAEEKQLPLIDRTKQVDRDHIK